ncbi:hypothetical protein [Caballeronia sp.]|uniref:hypothetical protein n=1 Tax=Caballeronia sp. TaxID=1931223 RepID=UPI003C34FF6B
MTSGDKNCVEFARMINWRDLGQFTALDQKQALFHHIGAEGCPEITRPPPLHYRGLDETGLLNNRRKDEIA